MNEGTLKRLDDRAGVSKSISFNPSHANRQYNPEYENIQNKNYPGNYLIQQNIQHRPTNSVFLS